MVTVENLIKTLKKNKINFFTGVPDSILKNFSNYLDKIKTLKNHVIATNEGSAISIGIGYYLATKKIPCIYLQNSGLSNAINPLVSVAEKNVYSIPLFLLIGWRGSPGSKDEPQHNAKGKITRELLKLLKINYCIINYNKDLTKVKKIIKRSYKEKSVVACLVKKNILQNHNKKKFNSSNKILRSDFIKKLLEEIPKKSKIISTTGYTSRELLEIRKKYKLKNGKDFYMVGGMGHSSSVALGYAIKSKKKTFCLDGDGAILMHLGSLRTIGYSKLKNYKHILLNNHTHESVGGQPTTAGDINFRKLSLGLGYKNYFKLISVKQINKELKKFIKASGPSLLEVKIKTQSMKTLGRPNNLIKIKEEFIKN